MTPIPSPRSKRRARIEIIPLIDIIFFLLATFVMVSLSMVKNQRNPCKPALCVHGHAARARRFRNHLNRRGGKPVFQQATGRCSATR